MTRLRQKIQRERERERVLSRSSERDWPQINQVWASHETTILQICNTKIKEKQLATPGLTGSMISAALKHADVSCWGRTWLNIKTLSVRLQVQIWAPARTATPQIRADVQEQYELPSAHYITWGASIRSRKAPSHSWHFINRICLRLSWHSRCSDDKPKFLGGIK